MSYKRCSIGLAVLTLCAHVTLHADQQQLPESPWTSSAEIGYVMTSGNTNTTTLNAKANVAYEVEKWKHAAQAETLRTDTDDVETANKWLLTYQSDYKFTERDYAFGLLSYEQDEFSGFDYQGKIVAGYGRKVTLTETQRLTLETGPGMRKFKQENMASDDDPFLYVAAKYAWDITPTSKFTQELTAEFGDEQDEWKSVSGLSAAINSTLSMKVTHTVKRLDTVPAGNDRYDRETALRLVVAFD